MGQKIAYVVAGAVAIAAMTIITWGTLAYIRMNRELNIKAGLTRCYVVGNAYPEWVDPRNCVRTAQ